MLRNFTLLLLGLTLGTASAQNTLTIHGNVKNKVHDLYFGDGSKLIMLDINEKGDFTITLNASGKFIPANFTSITPKYKLIQHTPTLWIEKNCTIDLDLSTQPATYTVSHKILFQALSEKIEHANKKQKIKLIEENPNQIPALYFLDEQKSRYKTKQVEHIASLIHDSSMQTNYAQRIRAYCDAKQKEDIKKGKTIENFTLPDKENAPIELLENNQQISIVSFLSSGCGYCILSIKELAKLHNQYGSKGNFVSVFLDDSYETWQLYKAEEKSKITWTNLWDEMGYANTYFDINTYPTFYIIDANHRVIEILKGINAKNINKITQFISSTTPQNNLH